MSQYSLHTGLWSRRCLPTTPALGGGRSPPPCRSAPWASRSQSRPSGRSLLSLRILYPGPSCFTLSPAWLLRRAQHLCTCLSRLHQPGPQSVSQLVPWTLVLTSVPSSPPRGCRPLLWSCSPLICSSSQSGQSSQRCSLLAWNIQALHIKPHPELLIGILPERAAGAVMSLSMSPDRTH